VQRDVIVSDSNDPLPFDCDGIAYVAHGMPMILVFVFGMLWKRCNVWTLCDSSNDEASDHLRRRFHLLLWLVQMLLSLVVVVLVLVS